MLLEYTLWAFAIITAGLYCVMIYLEEKKPLKKNRKLKSVNKNDFVKLPKTKKAPKKKLKA